MPKATNIWGALDMETLTYLDGVIVTQQELERQCATMQDAEKRTRVRVEVALIQVYTQEQGLALFKGANLWTDFLQYCAYYRIRSLWNYNAVYDFANVDYWLATNPNAERMKITAENFDKGGKHHKLGKDELQQRILFKELSGDMGQRYMYELHYVGKTKSRHTYAFELRLYDFKNILKGGLKQILEELDVRDENGQALRKLEMEYQAVNYDNMTPEELAYVEMDVKGLYFAVKKFDNYLREITQGRRSLVQGSKPSGLTASGIAKKEMLYFLCGYAKDATNVRKYQNRHPLTLKQDLYLRNTRLYRGGICYLNSNFCNVPVERQFFRYDVNSEYPSVMWEMRDLHGKLKQCDWAYFDKFRKAKNQCFIFRFKSIEWTLKRGKVPVFTNPFTGKNEVNGCIRKGDRNSYGFCMFVEEFDELCEFYEFEYEIENILVVNACTVKGYRAFVDYYYGKKLEAKQQKNNALQANAKLMLNGAYGKLSERTERKEIRHEINEETGCIHQVEVEEETDKTLKSERFQGLSILQGAYVTALARIKIMRYIREVCGNNLVDNFIYVDTDSVHAFCEYPKADGKKLGALKLEAVCQRGVFLGKKLYAEFEDARMCNGEVHTKGCNITQVCRSILAKYNVADMGHLEFRQFVKEFQYGKKFIVNAALNVKGGKAILPLEKELIKDNLLKANTVRLARIGENEFNEI